MSLNTLKQAARACGIALSYREDGDQLIQSNEKTIAKLLVHLKGASDPRNIIPELRQEKIREGLPRYIVCWDGICSPLWIWHGSIPHNISAKVANENRQTTNLNLKIEKSINRKHGYRLKLSGLVKISFGYHDLEIHIDNRIYKSFIISAPSQIQSGPKRWGAFAPVYALRSQNNQGIGGFRELRDAAIFIKKKGGSFIGTLPLLLMHSNSNNSPYAPSSRFFLNDAFLDITDLPGHTSEAQDFSYLNRLDHIDYIGTYSAKKKIIQQAARSFFEAYPEGDDGFKKYVSQKNYIKEYVDTFTDDEEKKYQLYSQYACHLQMEKIKASNGAELYLDYPVGVHPEGFDAKIFSYLFIEGFTVGAPPDKLGPKGQNWGFRPIDPQALTKDKFLYFRNSIQEYFNYSKMLRIDHIMGLYRIYCIPEGEDSSKGIYLHYPFNALLAILCLEASRHNGVIIGENLGTVPNIVNERMKRHGLLRMWVSQFELKASPLDTFKTIEEDMIAGMNTHDIFPFEAVMQNKDLSKLENMGILNKDDVMRLLKERKILMSNWLEKDRSFLEFLKNIASSSARYVIINFEDLWKETMPQNIPGTITEYPNWSKKFMIPMEDWNTHIEMNETFNALNTYRRQP